jgi:hypothetical protein
MQFLTLRALFLLAFVVAMPVLALPAVARRIDELIYPAPAVNFSAPAAQESVPNSALDQSPVVDHVSPASWQTPVEMKSPRGLESAEAEPPPLPAMPGFANNNSIPPEKAAPETPIDQATLDRLEQIRSRLEQLGAQYVLVEASDDAQSYRCHCQMLVDAQSNYTRPFEVKSAEPLEAAERVLREVEQWRLSAGAATTRR